MVSWLAVEYHEDPDVTVDFSFEDIDNTHVHVALALLVIRSLEYDSPEEGSLQPQRVSTPVRPRETASPMNRKVHRFCTHTSLSTRVSCTTCICLTGSTRICHHFAQTL